jgi:hypothetical protein
MATTTPNFGWAVPTSTDLVKDGAVAIETLGDSIDASLVDLKGGTTGQVLAKATNTDMDFTWSTPSTGSSFSNNGVLNSAFDIWQRGTSIAQTASATYTADRWCSLRASGTTGSTVSRQLTNDTTNLPFIQYAARVQRDSGNTGTFKIFFANNFETVNSSPFDGKQVTLSFYARAGANFSSASNALETKLIYGTGTDQNCLVAYTGETDVINQTATLTTTWQRFTYTASVPTASTELAIRFAYTPVGTAGANDWFEVTGVQLETGASATAFHTNQPTIQSELAACQRYYFRAFSDSGYKTFGVGTVTGVNNMNCFVNLPVQMRTIPSSLETSAMSTFYWEPGGGTTPTSITLATSATQNLGNVQVSKNSSFTVGYATGLFSNNTAAYLGFSAEL